MDTQILLLHTVRTPIVMTYIYKKIVIISQIGLFYHYNGS